MKKKDKKLVVFDAYEIELPSGKVKRGEIDLSPGDYGCDPLPDGTYRMVPSGDVVDYEESRRRLSRRKN